MVSARPATMQPKIFQAKKGQCCLFRSMFECFWIVGVVLMPSSNITKALHLKCTHRSVVVALQRNKLLQLPGLTCNKTKSYWRFIPSVMDYLAWSIFILFIYLFWLPNLLVLVGVFHLICISWEKDNKVWHWDTSSTATIEFTCRQITPV